MDTARLYAEGTSEEYLGKVGYQKHGINMATKLYPTHMLVRILKSAYHLNAENC